MATFQYITGERVENAKSYKLIRKKDDGSESEVATQDIIQVLGSTSVRSLVGAIGENGAPAEKPTVLLGDGAVNAQYFTPIAKLTEDGYVYYVRFDGYMKVLSRGTYLTNVPFNGYLYLPSQERVSNVTHNNTMELKTDGVYLTTSLGSVMVYDVDIELQDVTSAEVSSSVTIYSAHEEYIRSEYILRSALTNDYDGYCLGFISNTDYSGVPVYKIAYYDENLKFLAGATYNDIKEKFGTTKDCLTAAEIGQMAVTKLGTVEYEKAKFIVFSGYPGDTELDFVSLGKIYFPLFDTSTNDFLADGNNNLVVRAIGDGFFFKDSIDSNVVVHTKTGS